jgi:hypothetical protein
LTSDFPPHAPSSPTHAHILGMDRSTPVHMSDLGPDSSELIQKLVRENEKLRQRLAWHEDRRASHLLVEEDDDDWSVSSAGRVTRTDQISHSKLAAVPLRAVDVLRPADGAFIPEGLRSPMSRPSRFLGAGNMPSPNKLRTVVHAMPDLSLASAPLAASGMSSPRSGSTEGSPGSLRAKSFEAFSDRLKHLRELRRSSQDESEPDAKDADNQVLLKRGGVVVRTSIGYIQFGACPAWKGGGADAQCRHPPGNDQGLAARGHRRAAHLRGAPRALRLRARAEHVRGGVPGLLPILLAQARRGARGVGGG